MFTPKSNERKEKHLSISVCILTKPMFSLFTEGSLYFAAQFLEYAPSRKTDKSMTDT